MLNKIIISIFIAAAVLISPISITNSIAEAGYAGGVWNNDIEVDDSSVYRVDKNHVRVVYYIIMNRHTGSKMQDTADVQWGEKQKVMLSKGDKDGWSTDFVKELKIKLLKYCRENYS